MQLADRDAAEIIANDPVIYGEMRRLEELLSFEDRQLSGHHFRRNIDEGYEPSCDGNDNARVKDQLYRTWHLAINDCPTTTQHERRAILASLTAYIVICTIDITILSGDRNRHDGLSVKIRELAAYLGEFYTNATDPKIRQVD